MQKAAYGRFSVAHCKCDHKVATRLACRRHPHLSRWMFGGVDLQDLEEHDEFRYQSLITLMLFGDLFTSS